MTSLSYEQPASTDSHSLSWSKFVNTHLYHSRQWFNIHIDRGSKKREWTLDNAGVDKSARWNVGLDNAARRSKGGQRGSREAWEAITYLWVGIIQYLCTHVPTCCTVALRQKKATKSTWNVIYSWLRRLCDIH